MILRRALLPIYCPICLVQYAVVLCAVEAAQANLESAPLLVKHRAGELRTELASLDHSLPLANVMTMRERMGESVGEQRFRTLLLGSFAGFALVLACIGLYAVMSYSVSQRTREIAIRIALGGQPREILALVIRQALVLSFIGMVVGLIAALVLTRTMRALLFDVTPADPISFAISLGLLAGVAVLASYIPARRATKIDPLAALRYE